MNKQALRFYYKHLNYLIQKFNWLNTAVFIRNITFFILFIFTLSSKILVSSRYPCLNFIETEKMLSPPSSKYIQIFFSPPYILLQNLGYSQAYWDWDSCPSVLAWMMSCYYYISIEPTSVILCQTQHFKYLYYSVPLTLLYNKFDLFIY